MDMEVGERERESMHMERYGPTCGLTGACLETTCVFYSLFVAKANVKMIKTISNACEPMMSTDLASSSHLFDVLAVIVTICIDIAENCKNSNLRGVI